MKPPKPTLECRGGQRVTGNGIQDITFPLAKIDVNHLRVVPLLSLPPAWVGSDGDPLCPRPPLWRDSGGGAGDEIGGRDIAPRIIVQGEGLWVMFGTKNRQ